MKDTIRKNNITVVHVSGSMFLKGQHVVARTSWPKVKSITIDGGENSAQLILPEGTTTLNSNGTGTVDIKSDFQMLGTFHMPNVTQEDEMT